MGLQLSRWSSRRFGVLLLEQLYGNANVGKPAEIPSVTPLLSYVHANVVCRPKYLAPMPVVIANRRREPSYSIRTVGRGERCPASVRRNNRIRVSCDALPVAAIRLWINVLPISFRRTGR